MLTLLLMLAMGAEPEAKCVRELPLMIWTFRVTMKNAQMAGTRRRGREDEIRSRGVSRWQR